MEAANPPARGGFANRGANRGRGGRPQGAAQGRPMAPMVPMSLAKPKKSPEEELMQRFKALNPDAVRVTFYKVGSRVNEILIDGEWKSENDLITVLMQKEREDRVRIEIARSQARLGRAIASLEEATEEERRVLSMTQKEYNSFRAARQAGNQAQAPQGVQQAGLPGAMPAGPQGQAAAAGAAAPARQ